ncbi:hypothetical protein RAH42_06130 [Pyramidobacter sp. YE332]|uniref:hypothetical protein n=1 Tax=Pyramidobacter sp. YE332 TaxID=3068894 RepID=UPI00294AAD32|nr:hypothetical protein [Pyramidobacter sp. YE332]WOL41213.1 hypothetical protein RAH42_06130 [Pyramidobacter sp. YE332]
MIKRLFECLALGILAVLGLAKLRGKKVNPLALRVLLGILCLMAILVDSSLVLLYAGTWLLFLLAGDLGRKFNVNLNLFVPAGAENGNASLETEESSALILPAEDIATGSLKLAFLKKPLSLFARRKGKK